MIEVDTFGRFYPNSRLHLAPPLLKLTHDQGHIAPANAQLFERVWNAVRADRSLILLAHDRYLRESQMDVVMLLAGLDWLVKLHGDEKSEQLKLVYVVSTIEQKNTLIEFLNESIRFMPNQPKFRSKIAIDTIDECLQRSGENLRSVEKVMFGQMHRIVEPDKLWLLLKMIRSQVGNSAAAKNDDLVNLSCIYHAESFTPVMLNALQSLDTSMLWATNNPIEVAKQSNLKISLFPVFNNDNKVPLIDKMVGYQVKDGLGIVEDQSLHGCYRQCNDSWDSSLFVQANGKDGDYRSIIVPRLLTGPRDLFNILKLFSLKPDAPRDAEQRQLIFVFAPSDEDSLKIEKMFKFVEHVTRAHTDRGSLLNLLIKRQGLPLKQLCPVMHQTGTCSAGLFCSFRHMPNPNVVTRGEKCGVCNQQRPHPQEGKVDLQITNVLDANALKAIFVEGTASLNELKRRLNEQFNGCVAPSIVNNQHLTCGQLVAFENGQEGWFRAWVRSDQGGLFLKNGYLFYFFSPSNDWWVWQCT